MIRVALVIAATFAALLVVVPTQAQGTFPPKSFANLQVLPKDATAGQVINTMKGFTRALGVRCQFCHVGKEGLELDQFNFVSDEIPQKKTARIMMRMVVDANKHLDDGLPQSAGSAARVTCITCHRGAAKPVIAGQ